MDSKGCDLQIIADELRCSTTKVSRILKKHCLGTCQNRQKVFQLMTWSESMRGWIKRKNGQHSVRVVHGVEIALSAIGEVNTTDHTYAV